MANHARLHVIYRLRQEIVNESISVQYVPRLRCDGTRISGRSLYGGIVTL